MIRISAVDLVLSAGYDALEAGHANDAVRIPGGQDDIDLAFTDIRMPGTMDGIKLPHYIRDRWPPLKLIVASGAAIVEERTLPVGSSFFSKPYDDFTITEAMARLLASENPKVRSL